MQSRLEPPFGRHAEQRIGLRALRMTAAEQAQKKIAAERFVLLRERRLICARAESHLILPRKRMCRCAVAHARELQAMQQQSDLGRGMRTDLNALASGIGNQREKTVDAQLAAPKRCVRRKCMNQPRLNVANVAEVDLHKLFAALIEGE